LQRNPVDVLMGRWTLDASPFFVATDIMSRLFSPYDLNPKGVNPESMQSRGVYHADIRAA
jgi:NTE family protein